MNLIIEFKHKLRDFGLEWFGRYYGTYEGTVVDNNDPKGLNGLRINVPCVHGKQSPTRFAPPKGIYTGSGRGAIFLPAVGDNIWVSFEGGDVRFPIWEYGKPKERIEGAGPKVDVIQTGGGHRIEIDNETGFIRLKVKGGKTIEVSKNKISLGSDSNSGEPALLGTATIAELNKEKARIDKIIEAINSGTPIAQDGGIGYQQTMVAILNTIVDEADYSNVASEIVTLD